MALRLAQDPTTNAFREFGVRAYGCKAPPGRRRADAGAEAPAHGCKATSGRCRGWSPGQREHRWTDRL